MENQEPQDINSSSNTQPVQGQMVSSNKFSKLLIVIIVVVLILILAVAGFFVFQKSVGKNLKPYVFTVNENSIPQDEVSAIYGYYFSKDTNGNFNRENTLENIKNLYVENYILKKEFEEKNLNVSDMNERVNGYDVPLSLSDAPLSLKKIVIENTVMKEMLGDSVVSARSGEILVVRFAPAVTDSDFEELELTIQQRLLAFQQQLNNGASISAVSSNFLNDQSLKSSGKLTLDTASFTNVPKSHPSLPGDEYLKAVFQTPQGQGGIFKSGEGKNAIYGVVYPTTPLPTSEYSDFRVWIADQMKTVKVVTEFSSI